MSKVLLTGCAGFIGMRVAQMLVEAGYGVVGLDNEHDDGDLPVKTRRIEILEALDGFRYRRGDITDVVGLERVLAEDDVESVINLAALAGVRASIEDPAEYFRNNLIGNVNLLEASHKRGIGKYLVASSSSVYGNSSGKPCTEEDKVDTPASPYATTKCATELSSYTHQALYNMNISVMRFFTTYGPWGRPNMLMLRLIKWVAEGEQVAVFGDGKSSTRSYIYVDDLARGVLKVLEKVSGYQVFNLSGPERVTVNDLIAIVERCTGRQAKVNYLPAKAADALHSLGDISKAKRELGWEPQVSIEEGLAKTVEWYMQNRDWVKDALPTPDMA